MQKDAMQGSRNILDLLRDEAYKRKFRKEHPDFFDPSGTLIFCGAQGYGKTISAVQYVVKLAHQYPKSVLCTNVAINPDMFPEGYTVLGYNGLDDLKNLNNGYAGVIYLIDEIHLELNSLESKNVDIEVMIEISQQRKQRKHIVGTTQIYFRMAKPLREQVRDIVVCRNFFDCIQFNKWIDGFTAVEENGKMKADVKGRFIWFHSPKLYQSYDTFQKMRRYNKEWQGHKREVRSDV